MGKNANFDANAPGSKVGCVPVGRGAARNAVVENNQASGRSITSASDRQSSEFGAERPGNVLCLS